jgi:glutaredoxin
MPKYYINAVILEGCGYSKAANELLEKYSNIKKKYVFVNYNEKDKYKTELIQTFPQIYLKKENSNNNLLLGGYSELQNFINTFYGKYNDKQIDDFMEINPRWSKKGTLRLIELINNK